jgi:hypothetical protein
MTINFDTFYAAQTDYIAMLNNNFSTVQNYLNLHDMDINALKAAIGAGADLDFRLNSFNLAINGGLDYWQRGASTRPDCWTIENNAVNFAVSRESSIVELNTYSVKLENQGRLTQTLDNSIRLSLSSSFALTVGAWVYAANDNQARVGIYNGSVWQWSSYHDGGSVWEFLSIPLLQGSGAIPSQIKFVLDNATGTSYFNAIVAIKGNPNATPLFIANDPVIEEMRVLSYIELGTAGVRGVGMLRGTDRELFSRVRFMAPKKSTPTISFTDPGVTGYEITYTNADRYGFDLNVTEIDGYSGVNGFELNDIDWKAEI